MLARSIVSCEKNYKHKVLIKAYEFYIVKTMKTLMNKDKNGFTIIEVVLVLAIAGLIFLMVFIALPALQRSQRDTQKKK